MAASVNSRVLCASAAIALVGCVVAVAAATAEDAAQDLLGLTRHTEGSPIEMRDDKFMDLLRLKNRGFRLVCYLYSEQHEVGVEKKAKSMKQLRDEFGVVARSYYYEHHGLGRGNLPVYFTSLKFEASRKIFELLGVDRVPHIFVLQPEKVLRGDGRQLEISRQDVLTNRAMMAEDVADFIKGRTGLGVNAVTRPSIFDYTGIRIAVGVLAFSIIMVAYYVIKSGLARDPLLVWFFAAAVYLFSVSGGMFDIIRSVPWSTVNSEGRPQFFTDQQGQLGAEGAIMGFLYFSVGSSLSLITYFAPMISHKTLQRTAVYFAMTLMMISTMTIVNIYRWKTGYRMFFVGF